MFLLQLRNELWKLFGKKRTYIGFGMFLAAQNIIILLIHLLHGVRRITQLLEHNGFDPKQYITVLTIGTIMVALMAGTLMPLYTALVGGDLVAKEAEDGTLRMILSRPVSRFRLLTLKWVAGVIFSTILVASLGVFGLIFTSLWFPWGDMFTIPVPGVMDFGIFTAATGLKHYAMAHVLMIPDACTILTLAFMFSCFNIKPAAATILALSIMLISGILMDLPFFEDYRPWFITYDMRVWTSALAEKIPWWHVGEAFSVLLGYNVTFLVVGYTAFQMRDIKS